MKYYSFNTGDYARDTRHLTNMEDLAYRRLIDLYYDSEEALSGNVKALARRISMRENEEEIEAVLEDFFIKQEDGTYRHNRIEKDIAIYHEKADLARKNGKKGGRPTKNPKGSGQQPTENPSGSQQEPTENPAGFQKEPTENPVGLEDKPSGLSTGIDKKPDGNPEKSERKANHKPLTNNQEPITTTKEKTRGGGFADLKDLTVKVIEYLNLVGGKKHSFDEFHCELLQTLLEEGFTNDDFKKVIDFKSHQWKTNQKMNGYLRMETLFKASNFEGYLKEVRSNPEGEGRSCGICTYNTPPRKCSNLAKPGFDPSKCDAFISASQHR